MAQQAAPRMKIISLPTDVLSCIVQHLQQDAWQRDQKLDNVAALRSVCRSMRAAVDAIVTHAAFHPNVDVAELRSTTRRCKGLQTVKLQQLHSEAAAATLEALVTLPHLCGLDLPMFEAMQLKDWTRLSGLTVLTLRRINHTHHGTLAAVLPQLTMLRSLVLADDSESGLPAADVAQLTSLSLLTHLDLRWARGVADLAPQLPKLRSLVWHVVFSYDTVVQLDTVKRLAGQLSLTKLVATSGMDQLDLHRCGASIMVSLYQVSSQTCEPPPPQFHSILLQGMPCLTRLQTVARLLHGSCRIGEGVVPAGRLPYVALQELRLYAQKTTVDRAAQLATVAGRLHVLHLVRCGGALAQLLQAAVAVEDVSLQGAHGGGELLAALRPAARTLRVLDITDIDTTSHLTQADADHLAALPGLTSLAYGNRDEGMDPMAAISQLTRLQRLQLKPPSSFIEAQLARLSTLHCLTSLELEGWHEGVTGSWLAALAAAQVPLRELRLCDGAVVPGHGAEAAIGQLTRLTSLHLSVDRRRAPCHRVATVKEMPHSTHQVTRGRLDFAGVPLQLQLLGCSRAAQAADRASAIRGCCRRSSHTCAAMRNTILQNLSLECIGPLADDELAAAAGALPDLRRLEVSGSELAQDALAGLSGARLAAFSACQRLQDVWLWGPNPHLDRRHLVAQLPYIASLASLRVQQWPWKNGGSMAELRAAFLAEHGSHLKV